MFLFTGEDQFLLKKELQRREEGFLVKFPGGTIAHYNNDNRDIQKLTQDRLGHGLFVDKKMIIISGIPEDTISHNGLYERQVQEFIKNIFPHIATANNEHIIIFVSYKPDKRKKLFKDLLPHLTKKDFSQKKEKDLSPIVNQRVQTYIQEVHSEKITNYLITNVGYDSGRLRHEIQKIHDWIKKTNREFITEKQISTIIYRNRQADVFKITQNIFDQKDKVYAILYTLQQHGENWNKIMGTLLWMVKTLILYGLCIKGGHTSAGDIAKKIGIHPFAINNMSQHKAIIVQKIPNLSKSLDSLLEIDYKIKSGKIPDISFWPAIKSIVTAI